MFLSPGDLNRVKSKALLNLTTRQLVCFGCGALVGAPLFFLLRPPRHRHGGNGDDDRHAPRVFAGLAEGSVNKIKVIKRIMYGRCGHDMLRAKMLRLEARHSYVMLPTNSGKSQIVLDKGYI